MSVLVWSYDLVNRTWSPIVVAKPPKGRAASAGLAVLGRCVGVSPVPPLTY